MKTITTRTELIDRVIRDAHYAGILAQDGWETLELTVRANHAALSGDILKRLREKQRRGEII